MACKAVILDYIGTLVTPQNYSLEASITKLHKALCNAGLKTNPTEFQEAYKEAHEKHRGTRYQKLREVTNAVWVSEALNKIGCPVTLEDSWLKSGLNVFFQDFVNSLELRSHAKKLLEIASENCKVGLVSNFTYAPAIHSSLRKLKISQFFNTVVISHDVGWRKPHKMIFEQALKALQVKAEEAVYVGDSPTEDIKGAKAVGLKTVFVPSQFYSLAELQQCSEKPDLIVRDLREICADFARIIRLDCFEE